MKHAKSPQASFGQPKQKPLRSAVFASIAAFVVIAVTAGIAWAWLTNTPESLTNTFTPGEVTTHIEETLGSTKENVSIKNTGDTDAWIRCALVINWVDEDGFVQQEAPVEGEDYTLTIPSSSSWLEGDDGFYYFASPVSPDESTDILIQQAALTSTGEATATDQNLSLHVEILASGIQSSPETAFATSWGTTSGLSINQGKLS